MKLLLLLFCAVICHYCNGYPVTDGENSEDVSTADGAFLYYELDTTNHAFSKDYLHQVLSNDQEIMKSLVDEVNKEDLEKHERLNFDSELGNGNENGDVIVHITYDEDTGKIRIDNSEVEDTATVNTIYNRLRPLFFLALGAGIGLLIRLVWYLCRKGLREQKERDTECQIQNLSKV